MTDPVSEGVVSLHSPSPTLRAPSVTAQATGERLPVSSEILPSSRPIMQLVDVSLPSLAPQPVSGPAPITPAVPPQACLVGTVPE